MDKREQIEELFMLMDESVVLEYLIDRYNEESADPIRKHKVKSTLQWKFDILPKTQLDNESLMFTLWVEYPQLDKRMRLVMIRYNITTDESVQAAFRMFVLNVMRMIMFGKGPMDIGEVINGTANIHWLHENDDPYIPADHVITHKE